MAYYYLPGCIYTKQYPESSEKIKAYLRTRPDVVVAGCCHKSYQNMHTDDVAVNICPTCKFNLQEEAPHIKTLSIWELLADDDNFPWPDYHQTPITLQDCIDTRNNRPMQDAQRIILQRMNVKIVEIEDSFEKANFCRPRNDEQKKAVIQHCRDFYTTDVVTACCTGCVTAIKIGGFHGIHLMNLMTGECDLT